MSPNEHLTKFDKITVRLVVHFNHSPGIGPSSDLSTVSSGYDRIGTDDCEWDFALMVSYALDKRPRAYDDLFVLLNSLFVLVLVGRRLKDSDTVVMNIGKDLTSVLNHQETSDSPSA
jgi:hypothetical protein